MKILICEKTHEILPQTLIKQGFKCDYLPQTTHEELSEIIAGYRGIIVRSRFKIDKKLIDNSENLVFIARLGAGMENIDTNYAQEKGIICINSPQGNSDSVGEHTVGLLICLLRNISIADNQVKSGIWNRNMNRGYEIQGKTVGIIGYGNMGKAFAKRLAGFDTDVIFYDIDETIESDMFAKKVSLNELFERTQILSLHVPLTELTDKMINSEFISKFQKPFYLLNTARGQVVDTKSLAESIESGKILGAALDVLEYESSSFENFANDNSPTELQYLINSGKVIFTPHIAGRTHESEKKLATVTADKILAILANLK